MNGWILVSGDFVPHGGMDRANLELARHLAASTRVHVVAHRVAEDLATHPNVTVHRVAKPSGRSLIGARLLARAGRAVAGEFAPAGYRVVVNGANCDWPDVNWVHCVHSAYAAPVAGGTVRRLKTRLVHRWDRRSERRIIPKARVVICNSRKTARDVVETLGVAPERTRVVYLGIDAGEFPPVTPEERLAARAALAWDDRPWVGFVGQFGNNIKGFDTLYAAWRTLCRDSRWDANLAVVGTGPTLKTWQMRAEADGLAPRIRFLGFRRDVPVVLAACDAMVQPSRYDSYGLAAHEALCRGIPALVSSGCGIAERYPAELADLVLADPDDAVELGELLRAWHAGPARVAERVRPFSDTLRSYGWADMSRGILAAVEDDSR
jgi:glycosyltransferase involved in cell wall biosynthesis